MIVRSRAPVRVDFAGAWTDVSYFADPFKGATLNAAIRMYVTGELELDDELHAVFDAQQASIAGGAEEFQRPERPALSVSYGTPIPAGSGLGTSATLNCVWLALARREPVASDDDKMRIAALAYDVEKTLGIIGGKQDQYASAVGGINLFEFSADEVTRTAAKLPAERVRELEELLVLCYTGQARLSSNIHRNVWGNFRAGREGTVRALFNLRDSAYEARDALEQWDLEAFARILIHQRRWMKELDDSTSTQQIEDLFDLAAPEIMGGKPCGAGGGGCILFLARDGGAQERLSKALSEQGLTVMDVQFDFEGLTLITE
ncbi:MAG: hypothetical protein PVH68_16675 [Armatimonadota bacterium]|jgi:D-glycero-alpha-D-manno-heptose-7-phosphate kinase